MSGTPEAQDPNAEAKGAAKREADRAAAEITAGLRSSPGLRGPAWAWYTAGFLALGFSMVALHFMRPPVPGVEPELLAMGRGHSLPHGTGAPSAEAPARLDLSASMWRGALELSAPRLPADTFTAILLVDGSDQRWLVQRGDRLDPACQPSCGKLKLRVEVTALTPGPFHVLALVSPKPILPGATKSWLPNALDQPPLGMGVRAYAVAKVTR
jgi:hypothetical protein